MPVDNHPISREQLMAYLDGELPSTEMADASEHMAHCRECLESVEEFKALSRDLTEWQVPASFGAKAQCPRGVPPSRWRASVGSVGHLWPRYRAPMMAGLCLLPVIAVVSIAVSLWFRPRSLPDAPLASMRISAANGSEGQATESLNRAQPAPRAFQTSLSQGVDAAPQPMVARVAELHLIAGSFADTRKQVLRIVEDERGYVSRLELSEPTSGARTFTADLQIPSDRLDAALTALRRLGRVTSETQSGEDVTRQVVDLDARLTNLRAEEGRLNQILKDRTGKLADVLLVEEQISRVRGFIESAQVEQKTLATRVQFARIDLSVNEEYTRSLGSDQPISTGRRLQNAAVEGVQHLDNFAIETLVFLLSSGPLLLVLAGAVFLLIRGAEWYRRVRS